MICERLVLDDGCCGCEEVAKSTTEMLDSTVQRTLSGAVAKGSQGVKNRRVRILSAVTGSTVERRCDLVTLVVR